MVNIYRLKIESLYTDTFSVIETKPVQNPVTKITEKKEVETISNAPCRLSFNKSNNYKNEMTSSADTDVILFTAPELEIKEGSKIIILRCGKVIEASRTATPKLYDTHQEIELKIIKGYL